MNAMSDKIGMFYCEKCGIGHAPNTECPDDSLTKDDLDAAFEALMFCGPTRLPTQVFYEWLARHDCELLEEYDNWVLAQYEAGADPDSATRDRFLKERE